MNFLLHRHLAAVELGSDAAGAGAMLPDLWRMADRRVRAIPCVDAALGDDERFLDVVAGIEHHLESDAWFHSTLLFLEGERATGERLRHLRLRAPRMGLLGHITWELCLDGALVRRVGLDAVLAPLRAGLDDIADAAGRAADLYHFDRIARTSDEHAAFRARMARIAVELARGEWVARYASGAGLVELLGGVRRRLGLAPLDGDDQPRLAALLDERLDAAGGALGELLALRHA